MSSMLKALTAYNEAECCGRLGQLEQEAFCAAWRMCAARITEEVDNQINLGDAYVRQRIAYEHAMEIAKKIGKGED